MFFKIDLKDAYNQLQVAEESQKWLVINTHKGLFKYRRLPFGISSAPAIFQRTIAKVLEGVRGICIYMDDILISGKDEQENMQNSSQVFQKLQQHCFRIRRDKCSFCQPSVQYLGHIIDSLGIRVSNESVKAIQLMKAPKDQSELRSFLGMVNYFGKFFPHMSSYTLPLIQLLKKDTKWNWSSTH